jgi:hypothetical protein
VQEPAVIERLIIEVQVLELIAVGIRATFEIFVAKRRFVGTSPGYSRAGLVFLDHRSPLPYRPPVG